MRQTFKGTGLGDMAAIDVAKNTLTSDNDEQCLDTKSVMSILHKL